MPARALHNEDDEINAFTSVPWTNGHMAVGGHGRPEFGVRTLLGLDGEGIRTYSRTGRIRFKPLQTPKIELSTLLLLLSHSAPFPLTNDAISGGRYSRHASKMQPPRRLLRDGTIRKCSSISPKSQLDNCQGERNATDGRTGMDGMNRDRKGERDGNLIHVGGADYSTLTRVQSQKRNGIHRTRVNKAKLDCRTSSRF